ncbi:MAG: hypothetical protein ACYS47_14720 [Planctomycetota bacterium]|jgi:hypothetical protein
MHKTFIITATAALFLLFGTGLAVGQGGGKGGTASPPAKGPDPKAETPEPLAPPSPLEAEPPAKGFGRIRLSAWSGWVNASLRKDTATLEGDRLSWSRDLGGWPVFIAPALRVEYKIRRKVYGFLEFAWVSEYGSETVGAGGLRFDGVAFPAGRELDTSVTRLLGDLGVMAWGTVEESYRIAFALGTRVQSLRQVLEVSGGPKAVETTESVFPFVEVRGELILRKGLTLEGWGRASLFTLSHREIVVRETVILQRVDWGGNVVGEDVASQVRKRYLLTQINGMVEIGIGVRLDFTERLSGTAGLRFLFLNAERWGDDMREDMEWRTLGLELGLEARF